MYKYKRNGFTLVELMAVIIIISLIALLTFPNIINQIKKTKKSNNKMIEDVVIEQAKKYVNDNSDDFQEKKYCFSIDTLVDKDYVKDSLFKNSEFLDKKVIYITNTNEDDYNYKIMDKDKCSIYDYVDNEGNGYYGVDYIESTGEQYIDTEYYNNSNTKVDITFTYLRTNGDTYSNGMIYGSSDGVSGFPSLTLGLTRNNEIYYRNSDKSESFTNYLVNSNQKINVILHKSNISIDGNSYQSNMSLIKTQSAYSSYLFARHNVNDEVFSKFIGRIYSCKIYDGDEIIRDYIPVVDQKNKPCMFDKINKKCYYNKGSGDFITQDKYEELEYLEGTGTQYIDTEYYNNPNTKVDITFMYLRSNGETYSNGMIYGSANYSNGRPSYSIGLAKDDKIYYRNSDSSESFTNYLVNTNQKINVVTDRTNITVDGISYQHNMSIITDNAPYSSYIFARNNQGIVYSKLIGRIYSCKIYDGNKLVRDYIPVLYNDKPCLFDKVGKVCYYNQGTGEFLYG